MRQHCKDVGAFLSTDRDILYSIFPPLPSHTTNITLSVFFSINFEPMHANCNIKGHKENC
jgi:hypothetical protein